ncbi:hypothetical protein GALL_546410 [mine drainage metagenome]|uniref:Uncharacterized protein n=1 Tax=mine drainage metagenome TaxID=410659 RepID=A0A1J5NYJ1_9ZZZZ
MHDFIGQLGLAVAVSVNRVGCTPDTKTFAQSRSGPGDTAGSGQHGALKRSEVTDPHKQHPLVDGFGNFFVRDTWQDACQTIAATRNQCHISPAVSSPVDRCQPGRIIAGKPLIAQQSSGIDFNLMAQGTQPGKPSPEGSFVTHGT